jgi:hypothetical protein
LQQIAQQWESKNSYNQNPNLMQKKIWLHSI